MSILNTTYKNDLLLKVKDYYKINLSYEKNIFAEFDSLDFETYIKSELNDLLLISRSIVDSLDILVSKVIQKFPVKPEYNKDALRWDIKNGGTGMFCYLLIMDCIYNRLDIMFTIWVQPIKKINIE